MKKLAQSFNTAAQDSGSRIRESEALPLGHGALYPSTGYFRSVKEYIATTGSGYFKTL